jgi:tetratricopeptide (TPR) repeat protein
MPKLEVIKVFIASPGDLSEERNLFPQILENLNDIKAESINYQFKPVGWKDTLPGWGRPQELINEEVRQCDIFVMLLWKRWGTPSGEFSSGTEEEFQIAIERYKSTGTPHLLLYFRSVPQSMMADPGEQLQKVIKFRARVEEERICLFSPYDDPIQWKDLFMKHLSRWLDKKFYGKDYGLEEEEKVIQVPVEIEERILGLQKELEERTTQLETSQGKLRTEAVRNAVEATKLIDAGKFTLAEEMFARSIELYDEPEVLNNYGLFLYQIGSLDRAEEVFLKLSYHSGDKKERDFRAVAYNYLGVVYRTRGDLKRAKEMHQKALKIDESLGRRGGVADAYANLGVVCMAKGDLSGAEEMYEKALDIYIALGREEGVADAYTALGVVYTLTSSLDAAKEMFERALRINQSLGRKLGMAMNYGNLGIVYKSRGELSKANKLWSKAFHLYKELGNTKKVEQIRSWMASDDLDVPTFIRMKAD